MPLSQTAIWPGVGIDLAKHEAVRERGQESDGVEILDPHRLECRQHQRQNGRTRIAAVMADDLVERREQPVMGGRQRHDVAARLEHPGGAHALGARSSSICSSTSM